MYFYVGTFNIIAENPDHDSILEEFLAKIDELNESSTEKIKYFAITDDAFNKKYGLSKFPQVLFYRQGHYVTFNGKYIQHQ